MMRAHMNAHDTPAFALRRCAQHPCDCLSDAAARQLRNLTRLMRGAVNRAELDWLEAQAAAVVGEAEPAPWPVRHLTPAAPRPRKAELKYRRYGSGPKNASGRARS